MRIKQVIKLLKSTPVVFYSNAFFYYDENIKIACYKLGEDMGQLVRVNQVVLLHENCLFYSVENLYSINILTNEKKIVFENFNFSSNPPNNQLILVKSGENQSICYDTISATILWKKPISSYLVYYDSEDFFVTQKTFQEGHILTYDKRTGSLLWELDVSEYGRYITRGKERAGTLRKVIGMYEGVLLCVMSDRKLVALNPKTGNIEWDITTGLNIYGEPTDVLPHAYYLKWSIDKTKLYAFKNSMFVEVDLATRKVLRCKVMEDILTLNLEKQISIYDFEVKGNQLIFSGNYIGAMFHSGLIGAFNVDTESIDWLHEIELAPGEFIKEAPIVVENRIYLHTAENSLYVFDLQEDE